MAHFDEFSCGRNHNPCVALDLLLKLARRPTRKALEDSQSVFPTFAGFLVADLREGSERHKRGIFPPLQTCQKRLFSGNGTAEKYRNTRLVIFGTLEWVVQNKTRRSILGIVLG